MVYFPRLYPFSFLALLIFISACELKSDRKIHRLSMRTVYMLEDRSANSSDIIETDTSYLEFVFSRYDLVNIRDMDSTIVVRLRYADTNNFLGIDFYDGLTNAYFNCETAIRICNAQYFLKKINSDLSLAIYDASRPRHIQQLMWDSLKIHPDIKQSYLAPPEETSLHNYGCAVDAGIINISTDSLLDMGSDFDFFGKLSQPAHEAYFLSTGELSETAFQNRKLLRFVMQRAGMNPIRSEWWHFSMCKKEEAILRFPLIQ